MQSNELEALLGGETNSTTTTVPTVTDTIVPPPIAPTVNPYFLPTSLNAQALQDSVEERKKRADAEAQKLLQSIDLDPVTKATEDNWLVKAFSDMPEEGRNFRRGLMQNVRATKENWAKQISTSSGGGSVPQAQPDKINYMNINKYRGFTSDVDKDTKRKNLTYGLSTGDLILERINDDDFVFYNKGDGKRGNLPVARITNDGDIAGLTYVPDESLFNLAGMFNKDYRSHFKDTQDFNNYLHKIDRGEIKLDPSTRMLESPTGTTKNVRRALNIVNPQMATHSVADFYMPPETVENGQSKFNAYDIVPEVTGAIGATIGAATMGVTSVPVLAGMATLPTALNEVEDYTSGNQSAQETAVNIATDYGAGLVGMKAGGQFIDAVKAGGQWVKPLVTTMAASGGAAATQDAVYQVAINPELALTNDGADSEFKWDPMQTSAQFATGALLDGLFNVAEAGAGKLGRKINSKVKAAFTPKSIIKPDGTISTNAEEIVENIIASSDKLTKFDPQSNTTVDVTPDAAEVAKVVSDLDQAIKSGANDIDIDPVTGKVVYVNNPEKTIEIDGVVSTSAGTPVPQYNNKFILDERGVPVDPYNVEGAGYVLRDIIATDPQASNRSQIEKNKYFTTLLGDKTPLNNAYKNNEITPSTLPNYVTDILKHKELTNDAPINVNDPKLAITTAINEANNTLNGKFAPTEKEIEMLGDLSTQAKIARGEDITPAEKVFAAKELIVYAEKVKNALVEKVKTNPEHGAAAESIVNLAYSKTQSAKSPIEANKKFIDKNKNTDPLLLEDLGKKIEQQIVEDYPGLKETIDKPKPKTYPKEIEGYTQENINDVSRSKVSYEDTYNGNLVNNVIAALYDLKDKDLALEELKFAGVGPKYANQLIKNIENAVNKSVPDDNGIVHLNKDSFSFDRPTGAEVDWIEKEVIKPIVSNYTNPKLAEINTPLPVTGNNVDLSRAMLVIAPTA